MKSEISIIGYGRFGKFAAHKLKTHFSIVVADRARGWGARQAIRRVPLREAAQRKIIILAVPVRKLKAVLRSIAPHITQDSLVIDVCAVKEQPIRWMKTILPSHVSILGTHPLFGPNSASRSLRGHSIVLCPVRISKTKLRCVAQFLTKRGLAVKTLTPQAHDKLMATTLFLTQFVGRGLARMNLPSPSSSSQNYRLLSHIIHTTSQDSRELFRDMYRYNRHAHKAAAKASKHFQRLHRSLTP